MAERQPAERPAGVHSLPDELLAACLRPLELKDRWGKHSDRVAGRHVLPLLALPAQAPTAARRLTQALLRGPSVQALGSCGEQPAAAAVTEPLPGQQA